MSPLTASNLPAHVAIIMDGNGRWARRRGLPRIEGHRRGVETVREIVEAAREAGVRCLTLYAFSAENWRRPPDEVSALMGLLEHFLRRETKDLVRQRIRLRTIGRTQELPEPVCRELARAAAATESFTEHTLVLALNYGARTELLDAVQAYAAAAAAGRERVEATPDWETFRKYLYTSDLPDPDLIIRTSGEARLSNFLLMQAAYAEMVFSPVLWPDFTREDFATAVEEFSKRERRFGRTGEQVAVAKP